MKRSLSRSNSGVFLAIIVEEGTPEAPEAPAKRARKDRHPGQYFGPTARPPLHVLSTLVACEIRMRPEDVTPAMQRFCPWIKEWMGQEGHVFPSLEHAWQA